MKLVGEVQPFFLYVCIIAVTFSPCNLIQEASNLLEKRIKLVASLCEERQALNAKERAVTQSKLCCTLTPSRSGCELGYVCGC